MEDRLAIYPELSAEDRKDVSDKIQTLIKTLEREPKTLAWKLRSKVGVKSKWYKDVEDVTR